MLRILLAEFLGTCILVFAGAGAIVTNEVHSGAVTHPGIALVFGLVVMAMVYAFGRISGAHFNPAVTIGFFVAGKISILRAVFYISSQFTGAITASLFLKLIFFGEQTSMGVTIPHGSWWQSFLMEYLLTFILMLVIYLVSQGPENHRFMAGIAIGATVGLEAMFAGPVSGASMNPARSLGPALVAANLDYLWIYLSATTLGAISAIPISRILIHSPQEQLENLDCYRNVIKEFIIPLP